jgi:hypothetical protein
MERRQDGQVVITLVPYFGDLAKWRPMLAKWFEAYRAAGLDPSDSGPDPVVLLSDVDVTEAAAVHRCGVCQVSLDGFRDLIRPGHPFDVKGALVSAFLVGWHYPVLVLDIDATLNLNPAATLAPFKDAVIAMPLDHGALMHDRAPNLLSPYNSVKKLCAGVMWFGYSPNRGRLVAGYRRAWEELAALPAFPWSPPLPHLLEQYAWSLALHRRGGSILPVTMNWAPHFLGDNPFAVINHGFGFKKWSNA